MLFHEGSIKVRFNYILIKLYLQLQLQLTVLIHCVCSWNYTTMNTCSVLASLYAYQSASELHTSSTGVKVVPCCSQLLVTLQFCTEHCLHWLVSQLHHLLLSNKLMTLHCFTVLMTHDLHSNSLNNRLRNTLLNTVALYSNVLNWL